jgi:hypothetical protein
MVKTLKLRGQRVDNPVSKSDYLAFGDVLCGLSVENSNPADQSHWLKDRCSGIGMDFGTRLGR